MIRPADRWFGAEESWERPAPTPRQQRIDLTLALAAYLVGALGHELARSLGFLEGERWGPLWQHLSIASLAALVVVRRRLPLVVTALAGAHLFGLSLFMPMTGAQLTMQMMYFFLFFSGVTWSRDRRALVGVLVAVLVMGALFFAWTYAVSDAVAELRQRVDEDLGGQIGLFGPEMAAVLFTLLVNGLFFGLAIGLGQVAWRGARRQAQVVEQTDTIRAQADRLGAQAVVAERLRIAHELHDVVAHHVSVMGVQAAATRRVMDRDPEAASGALAAVERSSREAVGQMHDLLGALRSEEPADVGDPVAPLVGRRAPQPTLRALPELAEHSAPGCEVTVDLVESSPGAAELVSGPVQLSAYRIVQEALANVRRHSFARHARATVRVDEGEAWVEVEVVDDGMPRHGTSGSGLGLQGMRERAQLLGGAAEAGPRSGTPGWRVLARFPFERTGEATPDRLVADATLSP